MGTGVLCGRGRSLCHCGGVALLLLHHTARSGHLLSPLRCQQRGRGGGREQRREGGREQRGEGGREQRREGGSRGGREGAEGRGREGWSRGGREGDILYLYYRP